MQEKQNRWMLATFFLGGLIIGFLTGKFIPMTSSGLSNDAIIARGNDTANENTNDVPDAVAPLAQMDYGSYEQGRTRDGMWTLGSPQAPVKIEEFSDFQCPYCLNFVRNTFHKLLKDYVATGKVYYVYYNYPLNFHAQAEPAAQAALCAGDQKKYWDMHDALFREQSSWVGNANHLQVFEDLAEKLELDRASFGSCLRSKKYASQVQKDVKAGNSKGVSGTPSFIINGGQKIVGSQDYSEFQTIIENILQ